jgi:hypothetical protein
MEKGKRGRPPLPRREPIGKCKEFRNADILAIRENCPIHDCPRYDLLLPQGGRPIERRNLCPQCFREKANSYNEKHRAERREYARRYREHHKLHVPHYCCESTTEGFETYWRQCWSAKADRAIEEFWAKRGMTDEDAKIKFRGRPLPLKWRDPTVSRRHNGNPLNEFLGSV